MLLEVTTTKEGKAARKEVLRAVGRAADSHYPSYPTGRVYEFVFRHDEAAEAKAALERVRELDVVRVAQLEKPPRHESLSALERALWSEWSDAEWDDRVLLRTPSRLSSRKKGYGLLIEWADGAVTTITVRTGTPQKA